MNFFANAVALFFGAAVGNLLFSRIAFCIGICVLLWERHRSWQMAAGAALFHFGPWLVMAVGIFIYHQYGEPWGPWFCAGIAAMFVLLSAFSLTLLSRRKTRPASLGS